MPLIAINFKAYPQSMGELGLKLAKFCETVAEETADRSEICCKPGFYPRVLPTYRCR